MAYDPNELLSTATGIGSGLRVMSTVTQPKTFAAGSGTIAKCTPVAFDDPTHTWGVWAGGTTEVSRILADSTPATDGTFTISINGVESGPIPHDDIAADVETILEAMPNVAVGEATVAEVGGGLSDADDGITITFSGNLGEQDVDVTADFTLLIGNTHVLDTVTEGASLRIDGFVWPDDIVLVVGSEVLGQVMLQGRIHRDDTVVPATESRGSLDAAMRNGDLRDSGITVEGLVGFH